MMLRFDVYKNGKLAKGVDLGGAYVFGQDSIPMRADLVATDHQIACIKQSAGVSGLSLPWSLPTQGRYMLATTRLPDSKKPYNLNLELARARIMRLYQKREDWAIFDFNEADDLNREFDEIRGLFIKALHKNPTSPADASLLADQALDKAMLYGEKLALFHADILSKKRQAAGAQGVQFGGGVNLETNVELYRKRMAEAFGFISLPMPWAMVEPSEKVYEYAQVDTWVNWAARENKVIHAGPLVSFTEKNIPQWLGLWKNDFAALKNLIFDHIRRMVERYGQQVSVWNVISGIHAINAYDFGFEEIMELTRTCCQLVKSLAPNSQVMIELSMPWGEYYARNQRTIPPLLYADMAYQNDTKFDAFGLKLQMGVAADGHYVRDLMQISALMDEFVPHGKVVHLSACGVPACVKPDNGDAWGGKLPILPAGVWHANWSQRLQAEWLQAIYRLARSKSYVRSICWHDLADLPGHVIPHGGLCNASLKPKIAYQELCNLQGNKKSAGTGAG